MDVRIGARTLFVADDGNPVGPPVLLLHGITSSGRTWDWLVPVLAARHRLLRLDFRGHGRSDRTPGEYAPAGYVADAVAVLEQVGRPCVVIGHSLGGGTAAALTQQRPDLLAGAVLEDPPLGTTDGRPIALEGNALLDGFRLMRASIPRLQETGMPLDVLVRTLAAAPDTTGAGTFGDVLHSDALEAMASALLEVDATVLDPVLAGTSGSFLDPARGFGVPSLILAADPSKPDAVADPTVAQYYAERSPALEVRVIDGAGHLLHDERKSRGTFVAAVAEFLGRVAGA